jgi:hypothetical protein
LPSAAPTSTVHKIKDISGLENHSKTHEQCRRSRGHSHTPQILTMLEHQSVEYAMPFACSQDIPERSTCKHNERLDPELRLPSPSESAPTSRLRVSQSIRFVCRLVRHFLLHYVTEDRSSIQTEQADPHQLFRSRQGRQARFVRQARKNRNSRCLVQGNGRVPGFLFDLENDVPKAA